MPKYSHAELARWYQKFAKEVYEKVNIDVNRIEDIGRIKMFYFTKQLDVDQPLGAEGEFQYAYIPHEGLKYANPAPDIEASTPEEYIQWVMDNLNPKVTDDQIEKLMEMSKAGTLMVFAPGAGESDMQQVYTDEFGNISTSLPLEQMDTKNVNVVSEEDRFPDEPQLHPPKEPDPAAFGLTGFPPKPVKPTNMNPSIFAMIGYYLFGMDNDYAKLVRYQKDSETYEERWDKWYKSLDDEDNKVRGKNRNDDEYRRNVSEFKEAMHAREAYLQTVNEFLSHHLGLFSSIRQGMIGYRFDQNTPEKMLPDGTYATTNLHDKTVDHMKKLHATLPQGQLLTALERTNEQAGLGDRTRRVLKNLVGDDPLPGGLTAWLDRGVFNPADYKPKQYALPELPKLPDDKQYSDSEILGHRAKYSNLAAIAGFAALSLPDVAGEPKKEGLSAEETAALNYPNILKNLITEGSPNSKEYLVHLEPARAKAQEAVHAYDQGKMQPLADLLRSGIIQTNREAAKLSTLNSEHSLNTLYLINRMWSTVQSDPKLMEAVGLTPEQVQETRANIALYKVTTKGMEAKQALLEHALYKRNMTPEQMRQAGCDILFADEILLKVISSGTGIGEGLLDEVQVNNHKDMLIQTRKLDQLGTMGREDMGALVSSKTAFHQAFKAPKESNPEPVQAKEEPTLVKNAAPISMA